MKRNLTGIKDVDRMILEELDDRSLLTVCQVDKYCGSITDETFFKKRSLKNFPQESSSKPNYINWKQYYGTLVYIQSEKSIICDKIRNLLKEGKVNENSYYLTTFSTAYNTKFNYFVDKFVEGYHTDIPEYFSTTYRRYIQKVDLENDFSPNKEITAKEILAIKNMLNENMIPNDKFSPDILKFVNKQIYINLVPYDIKIRDICL